MIIPKRNMMDRIEQSFVLFKNNFLRIFLPFFLYNLVYFVVGYVIFSKAGNIALLELGDNKAGIDFFSVLNNTKTVIFISIGVIVFLLYLLLYIPFYLTLIRSIRDGFKGNRVNIKENFIYGFSRTLSSFATYYYIFLYVVGLPALLFITGGVLFNLTYFIELEAIYKDISIWLMVFSLVLFLVFSIYRGIKSKFSLFGAVDKDEFTKENFKKTLYYTKSNWWRILGNILFIGIIVSLVSGIFSTIIGILSSFNKTSIFDFLNFQDIQKILNGGNINDIIKLEDIKDIVSRLGEFDILSFIGDILNVGINTVGVVFVTIFIYILFKRLEFEDGDSERINKKLELINGKEKLELKDSKEKLELINGDEKIEL